MREKYRQRGTERKEEGERKREREREGDTPRKRVREITMKNVRCAYKLF